MVIAHDGDEEARGYAFSPDGRLMASWSDRGHFYVAKGDGEPLDADWRKPVYCTALDFSPDSRTLALGHAGGRIFFHDTQTWEESFWINPQIDHEEDYQLIHCSSDGQRLVFV